MKILHVLHHSLPQLSDGYSVRSHAILRAQAALGYQVVGLTGPQDEPALQNEDVIDGVRYVRSPGFSAASRAGLRGWERYRMLSSVISCVAKREHPDVIHVHSPVYNGLAAYRFSRKARIPCVYEIRAFWEDAAVDRNRFSATSLMYNIVRALETYLVRHADAVITICDGLRTEITKRGVPPDRVFVVPNAIEPETLHPQGRSENLARSLGLGQGPVFGFAGSLFTYEGVEDLLDVAPQVLQHYPNARFLIIGGGQQIEQVKRRAAEQKDGKIIWLPRVPHNRIAEYYSLIDCCVFARRSIRLTELVTPIKPLEAMAMQRTVVASDIGGHREMIEHERTGLLFRPQNASALAAALLRVAGDPQLMRTLAQNGQEYVLGHRTWKRVTRIYKDVYERAMKSCGTVTVGRAVLGDR